jgi:Type I phosphodiesterase / nucleotide pyrophosphatase
VTGFAALPATVERLLTGRPGGLPGLPDRCERVGVVLLDAFGRCFLERHADHPFLRRLRITGLSAQFPSTTTAHVTTMHTGRPVGEHGLYEWHVYEPAVDAIITPLRFSHAGAHARNTLALDPAALIAGDTLYQRLEAAGARSTVLQPAAFSPSTYDGVAAAGADLRPFARFDDGVAVLFDALQRPGYTYLYWDHIDAMGHTHGPESPQFDGAAVQALDALERGLRRIPGALLLVTADHGQVAVDPARVDYLDELWSGLVPLLRHRPAGSARDVFLHTRSPEEVIGGLAERLGDGARVCRADELVTPGPRLADVCVLPAPGRMAWLRSAAGVATTFRGHHGGLHADETETWVGALYS